MIVRAVAYFRIGASKSVIRMHVGSKGTFENGKACKFATGAGGVDEMQLFVSFGAQKVKASYDFVKHDLIQHLIAGAGLCSTLS
eukprot:scaffold13032_cov14-Tisochrysis_lutea.AAC.1